MSKALNLAAVVLLCVAAAAAIVALLAAGSWDPEGNLTFTAGGLLLFGLPAVAGLSVSASGPPFAWLGWLCVIAAVVGYGLFVGALWSVRDELDEGNVHVVNAALSLLLASMGLAAAALVLSRWGPGANAVLRTITAGSLLALLSVTALLIVALVTGAGDTTYFRVVAILAVLWVLGTALIPLLSRRRAVQ